MSTSFSSIPILDYSLSLSPSTKPKFLDQLRHALLEVGFLYLSNTGIDKELVDAVTRLGKEFFNLSQEEKRRIEMVNSPHFLGYSQLGNEITKHAIDWREQIDLATELPAPLPPPMEPLYRQLRGPNQWPSESLLPGFKQTYTAYIDQMTYLSTRFVSLIAESIGLPQSAFEKFYHGEGPGEDGKRRQDKLKIVRYPDVDELRQKGVEISKEEEGEVQGAVGPHKDSMLTSYVLQSTSHTGLQILNSLGQWIDAVPIPYTLVVAIGQGLEAMTQGVCVSTTHRVLSPKPGEGSRYSIPFFQGASYDSTFEGMDIPEDVLKLKRDVLRGKGSDDVEMTFRKEMFSRLGEATLMNRVKSHQDVAEKWYPHLLKIVRENAREEKKQREEERRVTHEGGVAS